MGKNEKTFFLLSLLFRSTLFLVEVYFLFSSIFSHFHFPSSSSPSSSPSATHLFFFCFTPSRQYFFFSFACSAATFEFACLQYSFSSHHHHVESESEKPMITLNVLKSEINFFSLVVAIICVGQQDRDGNHRNGGEEFHIIKIRTSLRI